MHHHKQATRSPRTTQVYQQGSITSCALWAAAAPGACAHMMSAPRLGLTNSQSVLLVPSLAALAFFSASLRSLERERPRLSSGLSLAVRRAALLAGALGSLSSFTGVISFIMAIIASMDA